MDERNQQELREQAEYGRKSKIALEVVSNFINNSRNIVFQSLINGGFDEQDIFRKVMYLRVLDKFEKAIHTNIEIGDLAEKELIENGE